MHSEETLEQAIMTEEQKGRKIAEGLSPLYSGNPTEFLDFAAEVAPMVRRYLDPDDATAWLPPKRLTHESDADYTSRCRANENDIVMVFVAKVLQGARGAGSIKFIEAMRDAAWMASKLVSMEHRSNRPSRDMVRDYMDNLHLLDGLGEASTSTLISFCVEILPLFKTHDIPISAEMAAMIVDDSGRISIKQHVWEAVAAIVQANRKGGVSRALVETIARYMNDPRSSSVNMREELSAMTGRKPERVKVPGVWESFRAPDGAERVRIILYPATEADEKRIEKALAKVADIAFARGGP